MTVMLILERFDDDDIVRFPRPTPRILLKSGLFSDDDA